MDAQLSSAATARSELSLLVTKFVDNASIALLIFRRSLFIVLVLTTRLVRREREPVTIASLRATHRERRTQIRARLAEFASVWRAATDERLWEELVFCIFTAGASARMGLRSIAAVRPLLAAGTHEELATALTGAHRYP